jgi:predicted ATPase
MRLTRIKIEGYRRLENVELGLDGLSTLIGPNGVGKSSFLDLLVLLGEAMKSNLARGIASRAGLGRLLSRGAAPKIALSLETEPVKWPDGDKSSPLKYELELVPSGSGYTIFKEHLTQQRGKPQPFRYIQRTSSDVRFYDPVTRNLEHPEWAFEPGELALAQVPRTYIDVERLRGSLANTRAYAPILLDERSVLRLPQTLQPNVLFPSPGGEDLLSALYRLRSEHGQTYERLIDALAAGFPGFERLEFPLVAGGQAALAWHEEGMKGPLYANELSSGTLRFLHLAAMLLSPDLPPILMLDEPELSFHPDLLRNFVELLMEAADRTQLVVATHSAPLIRWLEPSMVVVVQRSSSGAVFTRGDALNLGTWLKDYTLDQLVEMNVIEADA